MCFKFREAPGFSILLKMNFNLRTHLFSLPLILFTRVRTEVWFLDSTICFLLSPWKQEYFLFFWIAWAHLTKLNFKTIETVSTGFCAAVNPCQHPWQVGRDQAPARRRHLCDNSSTSKGEPGYPTWGFIIRTSPWGRFTDTGNSSWLQSTLISQK